MNPNDFLGITIIGVGLSALISFIKFQFGTKSNTTKLIIVLLAILLGTGYYFLQMSEHLFQIVINILGIASIIYGFIIKK